MRRALAALVIVLLVAGLLFVAAAGDEVASLGRSLARTVRDLDPTPRHPSAVTRSAPAAPGSPPPGPGVEAPGYTSIRFALAERDVSALLGRSEVSLGGALTRTRDVAARLAEGRIVLDTRNRFRLLGVTVADYSGHSDWTLAVVPEGLGVRLNELRVVGVPAPFVSWFLRRLSGRSRDGWVILATGPRHVLEGIEIDGGKLTVAGRVR